MTDASGPPIGQRFDHVYLERGAPVQDNARMRRRLYALFSNLELWGSNAFGKALEAELGVKLDHSLYGGGYIYEPFFLGAELRDVLSGITIISRQVANTAVQGRWLQGVERIFREENTTYRVDERGGVHYAPDEEFERNRASAVSALESARYAAAAQAFQGAQTGLNESDPKRAIRSTFEAVEIVFRLICQRAPRLGAAEVETHLKPVIAEQLGTDDAARRSAMQFADSLKAWADAAHWHRHGQGVEEPRDPPESLTIALISSGASYLRWLAELDRARPATGPQP